MGPRLVRHAEFDAELRQRSLDGEFFTEPSESAKYVEPSVSFVDVALIPDISRPLESIEVPRNEPDPPETVEPVLNFPIPARFLQWSVSSKWLNRLTILNVSAIVIVLFLIFLSDVRTATAPEKGRLLDFHEVRWQSEPTWDASGLRLLSDRLTTLSGQVAVKLENGIDVLLDGAADLQILSAGQIACHRGRLSLDVPPQPEPFRVRLPQYTILVLGTSFDIRVDAAGSTIHLKRGRVAIEGLPSSPFYLEAGGALTVSPAMEVKSFAASPEAMPAFSTMEDKTRSRLDAWKRQSQRFRDDPATVVFMGFERSSMKRELTGRLHWTQGPFPGKWALRFPMPQDDLFLPLNRDYPTATVMAWIRRDSTDETRKAFFYSDSIRWEFAGGGLRWQPKGGKACAPMPVPGDRVECWNHVAVVVDGSGGTVRHYLNGKEVFAEPWTTKSISGTDARLGGGVAAAEFLFAVPREHDRDGGSRERKADKIDACVPDFRGFRPADACPSRGPGR